jgi:hypothetical protein
MSAPVWETIRWYLAEWSVQAGEFSALRHTRIPFVVFKRRLSILGLIKSAVGNYSEKAILFTEELTGQNNTLIKDYHVFEANRKLTGIQESYKELLSR